MSYTSQCRTDVLSCFNAIEYGTMANIQLWLIEHGKRVPADITIRKILARLIASGDLRRHGHGVYCLPDRAPKSPPVVEWVESAVRAAYPNFLEPGQLRTLYQQQHGVKLAIETFILAIQQLRAKNKLISYHERAFAWNQAYRP